MPQKLDLEPIKELDLEPLDLEPVESNEPIRPDFISQVIGNIPSAASSVWETVNKPLLDVSPYGRQFSESITEPTLDDSESYWWPRIKGFIGGAAEGASDVISGLSSPLNLATAATGYGAAKTGIRGLGLATKALSAPVAAHGAMTAVDPNKEFSERAFGVAEMAGGLAGVKTKVKPKIKAQVAEFADQVIPPPTTEVPVVPVNTPENIPVPEMGPQAYAGPERRVSNQPLAEGMSDRRLDEMTRNYGFGKPIQQNASPELAANPFADVIKKRQAAMDAKNPGFKGTTPGISPEAIKARQAAMDAKAPGFKGTIADDVPEADPSDILRARLDSITKDPEVTAPKEVASIANEVETINVTPGLDEVTKRDMVRRAADFNKAALTSWDLSAPGRQGKAFILNKAWWTSLDDMVKAWGSPKAADLIHQSIIEHPSGYFQPSGIAQKVGLDLADAEEVFKSSVAGKAVRKYLGIEKSSRAHTAFLNKLRSDQFVSMMDKAKKAGVDADNNLVLAKAYSDFINSATGRGSLDFGNWKLSRNTNVLNDVFFAPKNLSGQIRTWNNVLNPVKYAQYDPVLRAQALRSLFGIAGVGVGVTQLAQLAGAKTSYDPTNTDFMKIKIGDTRIDPFGGYQQFPVAASRFILGQSTNPVTGKTTDLTAGKFGQSTRQSIAERFFVNRLAPMPSFIYAWMNNRDFDGKPFEWKKAAFDRVFPIAAQDMYELAQEDPSLSFILAAPTALGLAGTQTYSRE